MDFNVIFRNFFGLSTHNDERPYQDPEKSSRDEVFESHLNDLMRLFGFSYVAEPTMDEHQAYSSDTNLRDQYLKKDNNQCPQDDIPPDLSVQVFTETNPLPLFGQIMGEMMRQFSGMEHFFSNQFPAVQNPESLHDHFRKGYEIPDQSKLVDKDIDKEVKSKDIDTIIGSHNRRNGPTFFGQSMSTKTIRNADGTVETHKTVRDHQGNEETTVCYKKGDKEYCTITKKDKSGKEEIIENLINMDENEKDIFKPNPLGPMPSQPNTNFPFDKFFK